MKLVKIKPNDIIVDRRAQRGLDEKRVAEMAKAFNPELLCVPVVSKRADGTYHVCDGQHRCMCCIAAGFGDVPITMDVREGLSLDQEAQLFLDLNGNRKGARAFDKFSVRLTAKDPSALAIQATLKSVGCKMTTAKQHGGVMAVSAVESVYKHGNLERTMRALAAWLDGDPSAFANDLIRAVSAFLLACPHADPAHLGARLGSAAPDKLSVRIRREMKQMACSRTEAAVFVLTDIYNHRTAKPRRVSVHTNGMVAAPAAS